MNVTITPSRASGTVQAPPSKSMGHRALICGALSGGSVIKNLSYSKDIEATLACLEAMNVGLPLVTSNVQGIPDYVENGVTGFLCGPTDVDKFAEHLDILIKDESLRRKIGGYNREFVRKYHIAQSQKEVFDLLREQ